MIKLTVFTPTYNRAYLLPRLYESLKAQTTEDFIWMVVDDGSTDNTKELIEQWQGESPFEIVYRYKKNEGMHSGHNEAYANITTEYNVCIDSDDAMPPNAVEEILAELKEINDASVCGIVGLDQDRSGNIIGTRFPENLKRTKLNEIYLKYSITGDKKLVYKTALMQSVPPYPVYRGERFVPLDYKCLMLDQKYDLIPVNKVFCTVEYQPDGSTQNMLKQYRRHPRGFAFSRISRIDYGLTFKERAKNAVHLVSCALFSGDIHSLFRTKHTPLVIAAIPVGILLNLYIRSKTTKNP